MCCGLSFWKRIVTFCVTFGFGIFISNFFLAEKVNTTLRRIETTPQVQSTFFNPPKASKCINPLDELKQERAELMSWLDKNKNASKKQRNAKQKELEELESDIGVLEELKNFKEWDRKNNPDQKGVVTNLLHKEKCYEF